ncbi:MAG: TlpA family protein disulfide reductase [Pirellula sp.]|nr:TlpA family protein disulfide reductase [Pirellula sp.]
MNLKLHYAIAGLLSLVVVNHFVINSVGQEQSSNAEPASGRTFQVDDVAPALQVDHWLNGDPITSFSKDKVYVIEFWATWCGPCIKSMPHLSELADRYAKDGLIVVALTKSDEANTREAVEQFMSGPGKKYPFRYAFCESDTTYRDYMEAAGQKGIPCSFVIDRAGKLAYVGLPNDLDYVLERVMKGEWKGKTDADELREINDSIGKLGQLAQTDADKALEIAEHVRRVNPKRAQSLDFAYGEILALCKKKRFDRSREIIESMSGESNKTIDWTGVAMLSGLIASTELNPDGKHADFALGKIHAAEDALKDDWQSLLQVGIAYQIAGKKEKFREIMEKAIASCPDEQVKKSLKTALDLQMLNSGK